MDDNLDRLVDYFFEQTKKNRNTGSYRVIEAKIKHLLKKGIAPRPIALNIKKYKDDFDNRNHYKNEKTNHPKKKPKAKPKKDPNNLMDKDNFYYHPELQISNSAPIIILNEDGTFENSYDNEDFILKNKEYYCLKDILGYFYKRFHNLPKIPEKKAIGAINYVFENNVKSIVRFQNIPQMNSLDAMLYTIDAAFGETVVKDRHLSSGMIGLGNFIEEGIYLYKQKINESSIENLNHEHS